MLLFLFLCLKYQWSNKTGSVWILDPLQTLENIEHNMLWIIEITSHMCFHRHEVLYITIPSTSSSAGLEIAVPRLFLATQRYWPTSSLCTFCILRLPDSKMEMRVFSYNYRNKSCLLKAIKSYTVMWNSGPKLMKWRFVMLLFCL